MMRRIIVEFIAGMVLPPLGFLFFGSLHDVVYDRWGLDIFFGGDKAGGFTGLFLGVPIGALIGITLVDKLIFKSHGYNMFGLVVGFILSQFGILVGIFLIDRMGNKAIPFGLFITVCLVLIGYNIKSLFR